MERLSTQTCWPSHRTAWSPGCPWQIFLNSLVLMIWPSQASCLAARILQLRPVHEPKSQCQSLALKIGRQTTNHIAESQPTARTALSGLIQSISWGCGRLFSPHGTFFLSHLVQGRFKCSKRGSPPFPGVLIPQPSTAHCQPKRPVIRFCHYSPFFHAKHFLPLHACRLLTSPL